MSNDNYWKDRYQHAWTKSDKRERAIIEKIKAETGLTVHPVGLGAASSEYLPGTAAAAGFEKGGADLQVANTNIFLEVTGPQTVNIPANAALWVRPDKLENARVHLADHETWVIHWLERDGTLRVIRLDSRFFGFFDAGRFPIVHPIIKGTEETYSAIPATHVVVEPWEALIERLRAI